MALEQSLAKPREDRGKPGEIRQGGEGEDGDGELRGREDVKPSITDQEGNDINQYIGHKSAPQEDTWVHTHSVFSKPDYSLAHTTTAPLGQHPSDKYIGHVTGSGYKPHKERKENRPDEEKMFSCDQCDKKLSTAFSLKKHKMNHEGIRPYSCDECQKTFSNSSNLQTHKRVHTGEKPYSCDECFRPFSTSFGLKKHKQKHHLNKYQPL